ncbi:DUF1127 domain-containing protein [Roseospira visakhapatnamensis]|uniref:Uncharacterized protein YjiS (DUF1127 family) n=1 Tax=Roseospira visakhapatnamensis TaxID=390880 RepID=A0A7W6RDV0_9PROT|nr:DUF1127 domain-containing protein [Roseospira visakhapatnamensis]MBB4266632.1 uncharacterized protein YjiS (DUF1127 family) [Roseospira visakhapatnamensis]
MRAVSVSSAPIAVKAPLPSGGAIAALGSTVGIARHSGGAPLASLGVLGRLLVTWQTRAETRRQLAGLDARLLRDIGLHQDEVHQEIRKPFWIA